MILFQIQYIVDSYLESLIENLFFLIDEFSPFTFTDKTNMFALNSHILVYNQYGNHVIFFVLFIVLLVL